MKKTIKELGIKIGQYSNREFIAKVESETIGRILVVALNSEVEIPVGWEFKLEYRNGNWENEWWVYLVKP